MRGTIATLQITLPTVQPQNEWLIRLLVPRAVELFHVMATSRFDETRHDFILEVNRWFEEFNICDVAEKALCEYKITRDTLYAQMFRRYFLEKIDISLFSSNTNLTFASIAPQLDVLNVTQEDNGKTKIKYGRKDND